MITVTVHQNFLIQLFTHGHVTAPLRVRTGLPAGCILVGARWDSERGVALLDFVDGSKGRTEMKVVFDVGT